MVTQLVEPRLLTYEDYLALPETVQRYEIIDGEMIMTPAPNAEHQWIVGNLYRLLFDFAQRTQVGVVLTAPLDVLITRQPLRTRQPDVLFLSAQRTGLTNRQSLRGLQSLEMAPDLVVEVLSPSENPTDLAEKLADYALIGVQECWLVDPETETVEVVRWSGEGKEVRELFDSGDTLRSQVLPLLKLPVTEVFA